MPTNKIEALSESSESQYCILSPAVGYYSLSPERGAVLIGGSFIGKLRILNSVYELYIPDDVYGSVIPNPELDKITKVEYGQELFRLNPEKGLADTEKQHLKEIKEHSGEHEEGFLITAFTDGIFYSKPSPDAPSYVEVGDKIEKGKTIGLIEVMKSFNHIIFKGTDTSTTGTILKIFVGDSEEVKTGQPLILIGD